MLLGLTAIRRLLLGRVQLSELPPFDLLPCNRVGESEWQLFEIRYSPLMTTTNKTCLTKMQQASTCF